MEDNDVGSEESDRESVGEAGPSLSEDRLYRVLAETRRRRVLCLLLDVEETTVSALTTILTGWDATDAGTMARPNEHQETRVELVHTHLPLLAETEFIEYDREAGSVVLEPLDSEVSKLIRRSVEREPPSR